MKKYILLFLFVAGLLAAGFQHQSRIYKPRNWNDTMVPAMSVRVGASAPDFEQIGSTGLYNFNFDGVNTLEQVFFTVQLPHDYLEGTAIYPHVHFYPSTALAAGEGNKTVRFVLVYEVASINGSYDFLSQSSYVMNKTVNSDNTTSTPHHILATGSGIAMTGQTISNVLICRLYRDPADAGDTYEADAAFYARRLRDGFKLIEMNEL